MGTDNHRVSNGENSETLNRSQSMSSSPAEVTQNTFFVDSKSYYRAEKRAHWYLQDIQQLAGSNSFLNELLDDYQYWEKDSRPLFSSGMSLSSLESEQQTSELTSSWSFLEKLYGERKLKTYLSKSVNYIFLRDLGKDINCKSSVKQINSTVTRLHRWIIRHIEKDSNTSEASSNDHWSTSWLYEKAKQEGIESTFIWLMNKLSMVEMQLPRQLDQTNGMRKLVKIIAGVVLHQMIELPEHCSKLERQQKLNSAIRLGYSYGLTYPLVDDLLDSASILSEHEKDIFNQAIRQSLLCGDVVACPEFSEHNQPTMRFVYSELAHAFSCIKQFQTHDDARRFFEQAYVFFEAQDIDRKRQLSQQTFSSDELFLPIILKSAGCRLVARDILNARSDESFNRHTFCFGIYNQFNDDIKDIFDDIKEGNVTPYTYYLQQVKTVDKSSSQVDIKTFSQLNNPYRVYWAVVFYLIKHVYKDQPASKQLLLERSINAHKSLRSAVGKCVYRELTDIMLHTGNREFDQLISSLVEQPNDVAWFDKLVSRQVGEYFNQKKQTKQKFKRRYDVVSSFVKESITFKAHPKLRSSCLVDGANYSLQAGGKHIRAVLAYAMSVDRYEMDPKLIVPILQLLEYMHTASIIFDDKPSQDDADYRRGKPSLHKHCQSEAMAELTGVFMMMRAVEVQSRSKGFEPTRVLESLAYASSTTQAICEGQWLDLQSHQSQTDTRQLELICELKTGLAIEAALIIPAILAGEHDIEKGHIKLFAKHLGLAFQIKDDLLDFVGNEKVLGKPTMQDSMTGKASFVTCLGEEGAQKRLFEHYHAATEHLKYFGDAQEFVGQLLDFVVHRDR